MEKLGMFKFLELGTEITLNRVLKIKVKRQK